MKAGCKLDTAAQAKYQKIVEQLAELTTKFTQNVMKEEADVFIPLTTSDLSGLPDDLGKILF